MSRRIGTGPSGTGQGAGRGPAPGGGIGRSAVAAAYCLTPKCGAKEPYVRGTLYSTFTCPACEARMTEGG